MHNIANKADTTGAQREIERKTSDLEREGKHHTTGGSMWKIGDEEGRRADI